MTGKMSRMSFEPARHSVEQSMSLDRKAIRYKARPISESIYEDELVKNMTMEIHCEVTNTNPNSIFPIKYIVKGYNQSELCANIDGCLLYTSPSPRDGLLSRMPSSA